MEVKLFNNQENAMLIGREAELNYLQQIYEKEGSQLLILYGQKYIGKTSLIKEFAKNVPCHYYMSLSCSEKMQLSLMKTALLNNSHSEKDPDENVDSYYEIWNTCLKAAEEKQVIVIDEFQMLLKTASGFADELNRFLNDKKEKNQKVLFIMTSSSVGWVENTMVKKLGRTAFQISGLYKLKELPFTEIRKYFHTYTINDCMTIYGIAGGNPGILFAVDRTKTIEENIRNLFVKSNSFGRILGDMFLLDDLRETNVYNTVLLALAHGKNKLNDLYEETTFSRAKISVYLKNLIELEIVEKVFSYDTPGRAQTKKGIYRIKNKFISFWFTFIFPNMNKIEMMDEKEYYDTFVMPYLTEYLKDSYKDICLTYLPKILEKNHIELSLERFGEWVGKTGTIDIVAESDKKDIVCCFCKCEKLATTYEDYEWDLFSIQNARINPDYILLFSFQGFQEKLKQEAEKTNHLILVTLEDLFSFT